MSEQLKAGEQCEIDFQNGRIRRREGARLTDNPYPRETQGAQDWERGWKVEHYDLLRLESPELKAGECECPTRVTASATALAPTEGAR